MGHVLILDSDSAHAAELAHGLQAASCRTTVCLDRQQAIGISRAQQVDIVVLVPASSSQWRTDTESYCKAVREIENPPLIMCVLHGPSKGPSDRLYGDQLGVRVLHEE